MKAFIIAYPGSFLTCSTLDDARQLVQDRSDGSVGAEGVSRSMHVYKIEYVETYTPKLKLKEPGPAIPLDPNDPEDFPPEPVTA